MSAIHKIILRNFKAFNDTTEIRLDGNHLLMFGENGSGKSSIYWALYTLLQSANKSQADISKYFTPNNQENLINQTYLKNRPDFAIDVDGLITEPRSIGLNASVEVILENKTKLEINSTGFNGYRLDGENYILDEGLGKSLIENLNRSSDFISHRLLINFYNFRNSKDINLWEVFVRDIFPFLLTDIGRGNISLGELLKDIETNKPFYNFNGNTFKLRRSNHWSRITYHRKIDTFNTELNNWIDEINPMVNDFYNDHFKDKNDEEIKIVLSYDTILTFGNITQSAKQGNNTFYFFSKTHIDLNNPLIKFTIKIKDENDNWIVIARPQSYFNEAKLTQIALSVRFAFTLQRMGLFEGQILALDDLLISLDMSNREKILKIIYDVFAPQYKIYLFTHERTFFSKVLNRLNLNKLREFSVVKEVYSPSFLSRVTNKPTIKSYKSFITSAYSCYEKNDYPSCATYQRRHLEQWLHTFLPSLKVRSPKNSQVNSNLSYFIKIADEYFKEVGFNISILDKIKDHKNFLLNPLSHFDNDGSEIYKSEIEGVFETISELESYKISTIIAVNSTIKMIFDTLDNFTFTFQFTAVDNFNAYKIGNQIVSQDLVIKLNDNIQLTIDDNLGKIITHNYKYSYTNKSFNTIFNQINNTLIINKEGKMLNHGFSFENIIIDNAKMSDILVSI